MSTGPVVVGWLQSIFGVEEPPQPRPDELFQDLPAEPLHFPLPLHLAAVTLLASTRTVVYTICMGSRQAGSEARNLTLQWFPVSLQSALELVCKEIKLVKFESVQWSEEQ